MNLDELATELHDACLEIPEQEEKPFSRIVGYKEQYSGLRRERVRLAVEMSASLVSLEDDDGLGYIFVEDLESNGDEITFLSGTGMRMRVRLHSPAQGIRVQVEHSPFQVKYPFGRWRAAPNIAPS